MNIKTISYQKEKADIVKKLNEVGKEFDPEYKRAWSHLIAAYKLIGWKSVFFLVLKFQKYMNSKYELKPTYEDRKD